MIDMWLLFFIISTTINICIHIVVDFLRKSELTKKKKEEEEEDIDRVGQFSRPRTVTVKEVWQSLKIIKCGSWLMILPMDNKKSSI